MKIHTSYADSAKIIKALDTIARKANLLAVNAETAAASHSGEAGKRFASVANETRRLAALCAQTAKITVNAIKASAKNTDKESGVAVNP